MRNPGVGCMSDLWAATCGPHAPKGPEQVSPGQSGLRAVQPRVARRYRSPSPERATPVNSRLPRSIPDAPLSQAKYGQWVDCPVGHAANHLCIVDPPVEWRVWFWPLPCLVLPVWFCPTEGPTQRVRPAASVSPFQGLMCPVPRYPGQSGPRARATPGALGPAPPRGCSDLLYSGLAATRLVARDGPEVFSKKRLMRTLPREADDYPSASSRLAPRRTR